MFSTKGQGSLEYLLILGGAILVAVIVITAITSTPNPGNVGLNSLAATCQTSLNETVCEAVGAPDGVTIPATPVCAGTGGSNTACCWDNTAKRCSMNPGAHI